MSENLPCSTLFDTTLLGPPSRPNKVVLKCPLARMSVRTLPRHLCSQQGIPNRSALHIFNRERTLQSNSDYIEDHLMTSTCVVASWKCSCEHSDMCI